DSDMLGWVCERASGTRMADLISALIWQPMGAERDGEITCDPLGSAIHDGGVSATARDLARFGQLLVDDGLARGYPVIPAAWLAGRSAHRLPAGYAASLRRASRAPVGDGIARPVNGERRRARIPRRISWVAASLSGLTLGSVVVVAAIPHPPGGVPPLYAAGI